MSVAEEIDETVVRITRTFDAPRERVFAAWTEAKQLARWFAPDGFDVTACETVPGAGGAFRICLRSSEGRDYWIRGEYRDVERPARLSIACIAEDARGNPYLEERIDVTLEGKGTRTTLRLHASARALKAEALATARGMPELWARTIAQLHRHLARKN